VRVLAVNWQDRTNPQAGGAEVHLHEIYGRLAAAGHEVHLLCSGYGGAAKEAVLDGMSVHRTGSRYGFAIRGRSAFAALARAVRPEVVVEDVNKVPLFLPRVWDGPFVLLVPHLFGTTAFREVSWPVAAAVWAAERPMPWVYRRTRVHVISGSTRDDLVTRGFRAEAIRVIYPGVDTAAFSPDPLVARAERPTFLYVGRLKRYKALDTAIRAVAQLRRGDCPHVRLLIAGSGDDRPRLERVIAAERVQDAVTFLGFVAEERKLELYRQAWAVVFPSPKEGWGITNVEAAACGTPAVASDSPGLRESVRGGETGLLVPHGDVGAFSGALRTLVGDPALRERLGRGARAFAETLPWSRAARETATHLEEAVAEWHRPEAH